MVLSLANELLLQIQRIWKSSETLVLFAYQPPTLLSF